MDFTVMQPPSPGQQSPSVGSTSDTFPVHEHFSTDTPDVPKSIIVSMITDKNMFVACFIPGAKIQKLSELTKTFLISNFKDVH